MDLTFTADERAFADEARRWLDDNVSQPPPFASLDEEVEWGREWQARLAADRWVGIHWPTDYGGRAASPVQVALHNMEFARARAPQPLNRVGINLAGPTLLARGTEAQRRRWLASILDASELWCQLFSEPDAGSDLASLTTRAEQAPGGWRLSGQKVWTSYAAYARWGLALVRTDPDALRHAGLTCMVVDMEDPAIEVRPLVQITGDAEFSEVYLDGAFVADDQVVGDLGAGWSVANVTLAHERGTAFPFKEQVVHETYLDEVYELAKATGRLDDIEVADELAQSFVELRLLRLHNWRTLSRLGRGEEPGAESSLAKLAWTGMTQRLSAVALAAGGDAAPLWAGAEGTPGDGRWQHQWLWSMAASIAGGTSEIQRTIVAERLLGLPRG